MKNLKYTSFLITLVSILTLGFTACSSSDDNESKDMTYPEIKTEGITANPIDCQVYKRGEVIPVCFLFTDDTELGAYNIEIHHNFDHHTHSTSATECEMDANKQPQHPWTFNNDYVIPEGLHEYNASFSIPIPKDIDTGDYHFMVRVTDKAGWQQLRAMAIKIVE